MSHTLFYPHVRHRHAEIDTMHKIIRRQEIEIYEQSGAFMKNFSETPLARLKTKPAAKSTSMLELRARKEGQV